MILQSEKIPTRSNKEQLIDIDLRNLADAIDNLPTSNPIRFSAMMYQVGAGDPTYGYINNDITPVSITRVTTGIYSVLFTGSPLTSKTECFISTSIQGTIPGAYSSVFVQNSNELTILTRDSAGLYTDDVLEASLLSVTVWP